MASPVSTKREVRFQLAAEGDAEAWLLRSALARFDSHGCSGLGLCSACARPQSLRAPNSCSQNWPRTASLPFGCCRQIVRM